MTAGQHRTDGPVRLDTLFDNALAHLAPPPAPPAGPASSPAPAATDGFLFSGNRQDSVPRALLLDRRLTPLERNAWQVFRLMLTNDGITAMPTYDQLAPWLAAMPCASRASHETVARTLTLLRLTRWISLVRRRRDPRTGRIQGNLYVLHDEPLTPYEAIQLDADYLELLSQSLTHASKSIQRVSIHTLQELAHDPMLSEQVLPSRLDILSRRLAAQDWNMPSPCSPPGDKPDPEDGSHTPLRNQQAPASESEVASKPSHDNSLRIPKSDSTVRKKEKNEEVRTVPRGLGMLRLPDRFLALKAEQQSGALVAMQSVDAELHQALLDEWEARCATTSVRNPAGYLFGIIQKALKGEFRSWAGQKAPSVLVDKESVPASPPPQPAPPEVAKAHIARLRALLNLS